MNAIEQAYLHNQRLAHPEAFSVSGQLSESLQNQLVLERLAGLALVPVASHQDSQWVAPALAVYGKQRQYGETPFGVVLATNYPAGTQRSHVDVISKAATEACATYPNMQIAHLDMGEMPHDIRIGMIRKMLWDAVFLAGAFERPEGSELVLFNHDIDTIKHSRELMTHTIKQHQAGGFQHVLHSRIRHDLLANAPRLNKLLQLYDALLNNCGLAMSATTSLTPRRFVDLNGFSDREEVHECRNFVSNSEEVSQTTVTTSGRRLRATFRRGSAKPWGSRTFSITESYRTDPEEGDIDEETYASVLTEVPDQARLYARTIVDNMNIKADMSPEDIERAAARLRRIIRLNEGLIVHYGLKRYGLGKLEFRDALNESLRELGGIFVV